MVTGVMGGARNGGGGGGGDGVNSVIGLFIE